MKDPQKDILAFWFEKTQPAQWFQVNPDFDAEIAERYADAYDLGARGVYDDWKTDSDGCLALCILLDQFPRNMFRGQAQAFATDALALAAAKRAVAEGWDLDAPEPERQFFYLPYEHSEDPADQAAAVRLIGERLPETGAETLLHARAHQAIIARFGRFPFRNAALGREDTAAEAAFLAEGGYAAEVRRLSG